jgi:hypothetical protein
MTLISVYALISALDTSMCCFLQRIQWGLSKCAFLNGSIDHYLSQRRHERHEMLTDPVGAMAYTASPSFTSSGRLLDLRLYFQSLPSFPWAWMFCYEGFVQFGIDPLGFRKTQIFLTSTTRILSCVNDIYTKNVKIDGLRMLLLT